MTKIKMGNSKSKRLEHKLTFDKVKIIMTEEESKKLNDEFIKYVEQHGVYFGFVSHLLEGIKSND